MHRTAPRPSDPERWASDEAKAASAAFVLRGAAASRTRPTAAGQIVYVRGIERRRHRDVHDGVFLQRLGGPALDGTPALSDWYERLLERPAFARTISEMLAADLELSQPVEGAFGGRQAPRPVATGA